MDQFQGETLARLRGIEEILKEVKTDLTDFDRRVRDLEHIASQGKAYASVFGLVAGTLAGLVMKFIK